MVVTMNVTRVLLVSSSMMSTSVRVVLVAPTRMLLYQLAINVPQVLSVLPIVLPVNAVNRAKCLKAIQTVNTVA